MKKVYVLCGDQYWHKEDVAEAFLEGIFEEKPIITANAEDIPWDDMEKQVALFIDMKPDNQTLINRNGVDHWRTSEREEALCRYVEAGNGALFVHAGLVGIYLDSVYHKVVGGAFINHPPMTTITYHPVNPTHPIMEGVKSFAGTDEKYTCQVDPDVEVLMVATDPGNAGCISAWCKNLGKGRSVSFAPGHGAKIARDPQVKKFMQNAVKWLMNEE